MQVKEIICHQYLTAAAETGMKIGHRPNIIFNFNKTIFFNLIIFINLFNFIPQILCDESNLESFQFYYIGCFEIPIQLLKNSVITGNVDGCILFCERSYFRYAVLSPDDRCSCSNELLSDKEKLEISLCSIRCSKNKSHFCGGPDGMASYYTTGLSGSPKNLRVSKSSENSLDLEWDKTRKEDQVTTFSIKAQVIKTFASYPILMEREWTLERNESRFSLSDLHPGTTYNVSISAWCAGQDCGTSTIVTDTQIGEPDPPPSEPRILNRTEHTLTVELKPALNNNGPISFVRIIVHIMDDLIVQNFDPELLGNYNRSKLDGVSYYITAEQRFNNNTIDFLVGDGFNYRGFYNAPLPPNSHAHVLLGYISVHNGISRTKYSSASHEQHENLGIIFHDHIEDNKDEPSILALSIACVIFGILLIFSIIAYAVLRYKTKHKRQRLSDMHELTLQGPMVEMENGGFTSDEFAKGDFKTQLNNLVDNLDGSQKFARNTIRLNINHIIGKGKFGEVLTGKLYTSSQGIDCECHVISDDMEYPEQNDFLQEFDQLIRLTPHDKFVHFYGISASLDWLYIVFERYSMSLKNKLIQSRVPQAVNSTRFSTLSEETVIQWIYEISVAMEYLEVNKGVHKKLCSYNVYLSDSNHIKVSLFGPQIPVIGDDESKAIDPKRWQSPETLLYNHYSIKSDVWSFACVAWECVTLGGTLYPTIASQDLLQRIKNGARPEQPTFLYSDLYQLLLNCWQLEPSERPDFEEIAFNIRQILTSPRHTIKFDRVDNITIPYYLPLLEATC